mmetsp:Transcript_22770/g.62933  ORF Transcript_22770/g.62933 Transcript_22770/m.62933 type:complete len:109 (-) Transcript_22770:671-997(-)
MNDEDGGGDVSVHPLLLAPQLKQASFNPVVHSQAPCLHMLYHQPNHDEHYSEPHQGFTTCTASTSDLRRFTCKTHPPTMIALHSPFHRRVVACTMGKAPAPEHKLVKK